MWDIRGEADLWKYDNLVDAMGSSFLDSINEPMPPAQTVNPWHRCNGTVLLPIMHKNWQDEVGW